MRYTTAMRHNQLYASQSYVRYSANFISRLTVEGKRPQERILIQQKTREINAILASPGMKDIIGSSSFIFPRLPRFNANLVFPEVLQEQNAEEQDDANPEQVPEQLDQVQEEVMQETGLGAFIPGTEEGWGIGPRLPSFQPPRFDPLAPKTISASLTIKMVVLTLCLGSFVYWSILPELNSIEYIPPRLICEPVRQPYDLNINALRESLNVATGSKEFGLGMSEKLIIEKLPTESTSRLRLTLDGFPDDDSPKSAGFYIAMIILAMTVTAAAAGFSSIR